MAYPSQDPDDLTDSDSLPAPRKRTLILGTVALSALALFLAASYAGTIGAGIWWSTKSTATCTVTSKSSQSWECGKGGQPGVSYTIHTAECGTLIVTSGSWSFGVPETTALGLSLQPGHTYDMDLRGWHGWPDAPLAIMSAT